MRKEESLPSLALRLLSFLAAWLFCAGFVPGGLLSLTAAPAQPVAPPSGEPFPVAPRICASRSGQFLIRAAGGPLVPRGLSNLETNQSFIQLEPALLAVSCDRIQQSLGRQLGATAPWSGRIYVAVLPARSAEDPITVTSERFRDGWRYRVDMPAVVERSRYVRALVQVLLLEMANRKAGERSAELPAWLSEGFSRQLLASTNSELEIILPPPQATPGGMLVRSTMVNTRRGDPLAEAHKWLSAGSPLTFQELSWPSPEQVSGEAGAVFACSAQLFVTELLKLPDGPACLRAMLEDLPRYYNWQYSFLKAFRSRFQRPLDVEKWWALQVVHFTGRELTQTWPPEQSWHKLDELVRSAVEVHVGTNELPLQAEVKLQTIIRQWDGSRQTQALQGKIRELESLRLRLAPELVPLADQYRQVLTAYLQSREQGGSFLGLGKRAARRRAAEETLRKLDALDVQRAGVRPSVKPAPAIQAQFQPGRLSGAGKPASSWNKTFC